MTEEPESKDILRMFNDEQMTAWMEEHLPELQKTISGQRILYTSFVISFAAGLVAHVVGYFLLSSVSGGLLGLLADLLHAFGWSLWTGAVVAVFIEVIPEVKQRQIRRVIKAYESWRRDKTQTSGDHT